MKRIAPLALALGFLTQISSAQVTEEKLDWHSLAKAPSAAKSSKLQAQKKAETEKKWAECANQGKANSSKFASIKGWVMISWLRCARELSLDKSQADPLQSALKALDSSTDLLIAGPWSNSLWSESIRSRLTLLELLLKTKSESAWKQIETLLEQRDHLDKAQKAKVLSAAGEISQAKAQAKAAQFFYEQSLAEQETRSTREKLNSLLFALNEKKEKEEERVKSDAGPEVEGNFAERFQNSTKSNDLVTLLDDCIDYLRQYPGGRRARWAQDKVMEIYFGILDQNKDSKAKSLLDRALDLIEKSDSLRQVEWTRQMHRRGDFFGCLKIAEKSLETLSGSSTGASLLYMAGRCAQFSGEYKKAKKHFEKYLEQFAGGEDAGEVNFRLGLVHLRLGQASSAIASFEKLLQSKNSDRYELNARYWLARSFQATSNTRALSEVDEILSKYPMSYYGLRLRMERTSGLMEWPTPLKAGNDLKGNFTLSSTQKKALSRAELLAQNGWIAEALLELTEIPVPTDPKIKVLLAKKFNRLQLFPPVIRLVNEAGDLNPELRALDVVNLSFPQVYKDVIQEQAARQKLSPILVRSLIRQESAFGPRAISTSNAYGLMQIIGPTAQEISSELNLKSLVIPDDVYVPENNIQMGTYYIAKMIRQFGGNVPLGLAAYNAGPTRMRIFVEARSEVSEQTKKSSSDPWDEMWFDEVPWNETSFYVKAILRNALLYQLAEKAEAKEPDQRRVQFGSVLWSNLVLQP
ncbi:MAG: transglycosylase SLT domain-containing protein [Pseudobdellovibrionaceae bacterium]